MVLVCASGKTGSATFARNLSRNSFARGFGGTNVSLVSFASKDAKILPEPDAPLPLNEQLTFWPGGGGELNHEAMPERSFDLSIFLGRSETVEQESEGIYSYVLILGENRWEVFQIWLDGDPYRCLFPEQHKAASKSHVLGPEAKATSCWLLDGRPEGELRLRIKGSVAGRTAEGRGRVGSRWRVARVLLCLLAGDRDCQKHWDQAAQAFRLDRLDLVLWSASAWPVTDLLRPLTRMVAHEEMDAACLEADPMMDWPLAFRAARNLPDDELQHQVWRMISADEVSIQALLSSRCRAGAQWATLVKLGFCMDMAPNCVKSHVFALEFIIITECPS
eukprot:g14001.t1